MIRQALGLFIALTALGSVAQADDYFTDPSAGSDQGKWDASSADVELTSKGAVFSGRRDAERAYVRTTASEYDKASFVAEATVKMDGDGPSGIAYFGLGKGEADPGAFSQPSDGVVEALVVCPSKFTQKLMLLEPDGEKGAINGPGDGTHRVRMTWDAAKKVALFEVDDTWNGQAFRTRYRLLGGPVTQEIADRSGHLFFGGGRGVAFSDFSVRAADEKDIANIESGELSSEARNTQNWLPPEGTPADKSLATVDALLAPLGGQARLLGCWYQGTKLVASPAFANGRLEANNTIWQSTVKAAKKDGVVDFDVNFKLTKGQANSAGVAVAFDFLKWDADNYVFAPAMLYNGNKFKIVPEPYPPYIYDPKDKPLDMPITTTGILRLNKDRSPGLVEMKTFNLATPMMGFYDRQAKRGFLLLTDPRTEQGVLGMMVQEDPEKKLLTMVVNAPGVRTERYNGYTKSARAESRDQGAAFKQGDDISLRFKLYEFAADGIPAFMAKVFDIRKALSGANTYVNKIPYSAAFEIIGQHQEKTKYFEDGEWGYYMNRLSGRAGHNQLGWGGNPVYSQPPTIGGSKEQLRRVGKTWDMMTQAQGKTGLFYAMFHKGEHFGDGFKESKDRRSISMVRRTGDVLFFGLQQLEIIKAQGEGKMIKPEWEQMMRRAADALVAIYDKYGQFGQHADADTGEMDINGSTAGAACVSGLALAYQYFKDPKYLKTAEAAGQMYYERDLSQGYAGGGAAEILQSPDSEAPWDLCEGYMALYEATGQDIWLQRARDAINLLSTWTVSYDYEFPPTTDLGRIDAKITGSIFASSANNHSAPGFYIMSGDFLLRYYRATGDPRYAEYYKDIVHNVTQYVNTEKNKIQSGGGEGFVSERVQMSDWEGGNIGTVSHSDSNYSWECLVQLAASQNPGIYLNTTTGAMLVLDHVKTEIVSRDVRGTKLKLTNDSLYPAKVSIFAETAEQAKKPLGYTAFLKWPKVEVGLGQTVHVLVKPDGTIVKER